jgi:hypothetical protein
LPVDAGLTNPQQALNSSFHSPFTNERLHSRMEAVMYAVREKLLDIP